MHIINKIIASSKGHREILQETNTEIQSKTWYLVGKLWMTVSEIRDEGYKAQIHLFNAHHELPT